MIELQNLSKQYERVLAGDNLNLTIGDGEFFGLLGPNGAGKTTTISMLSTLLLPTTGTIWINGIPGAPLLYAIEKNTGTLRRITGLLRTFGLSETNG